MHRRNLKHHGWGQTAAHYQWHPFVNVGHYELAKQLSGPERDKVVEYYKKGIELVMNKASKNAFYRGIPFIGAATT